MKVLSPDRHFPMLMKNPKNNIVNARGRLRFSSKKFKKMKNSQNETMSDFF